MDKKTKGLLSICNDEEHLRYVITILLDHNGIRDHLEILNSNLLSLGKRYGWKRIKFASYLKEWKNNEAIAK